jgi:hypothetical protein
VKFGCSESSSAGTAALLLAAPEKGLGAAAGAGDDEDEDEDDAEDEDDGAAAEELTGAAAASDAPVAAAESAELAALFAVASPADDALSVVFAAVVADPFGCGGLLSSANPAVTTKKPATTKIAARSSTLKVRLLSTATAPLAPR